MLKMILMLLALLVGTLACGGEPPSEGVGYQPPTPPPSPAVEVEKKTASGPSLKRVLPRLKRSSRYSWSRHSVIVPGHLASSLVENVDDGSDESRHVLTFIVNDLLAQPQRLAYFRSLPPELNKRPGRIEKGHRLTILVADRFEVMIRTEHPSHSSYEKLKYWHDQMRLSELVVLSRATAP